MREFGWTEEPGRGSSQEPPYTSDADSGSWGEEWREPGTGVPSYSPGTDLGSSVIVTGRPDRPEGGDGKPARVEIRGWIRMDKLMLAGVSLHKALANEDAFLEYRPEDRDTYLVVRPREWETLFPLS